MYFRQFYLGCLAHASYLVGSRGAAAVIDPQRDVEGYLEEAARAGLEIRYVIETHFHADFVSGHRELARRTGATIVIQQNARPAFEHLGVAEGDTLRVGDVVLRIIETPGHTPEGISVLAVDTANPDEPGRLMSGDTLFIGDVGRPDLAGSRGFSKEEMAGMLYDSLHDKLLKLDDDVEVYPAHGAGSLCGRNISSETMSTIGAERRSNYALQPMSRGDFVDLVTANLPEVPAYFLKDAERNRTGAESLDVISNPEAIAAQDLHAVRETYLVLDVRPAEAFGEAHVPESLNVALDGQFAPWAGSLIPIGTPMILVAESEDQVSEAVRRLARVGHESVEGYLDGGMDLWRKAGLPVGRVPQMSATRLRTDISAGRGPMILDVRRPAEFQNGHVPGATNMPLDRLSEQASLLDRDRPIVAVCQSGYRSSAATSILERMGFTHVRNLSGGTTAWVGEGHRVVSGDLAGVA